MPLHRDIFWIGHQWAVTGYGMQAIHQKRYGDFDIEAGKIWDEDVRKVLAAESWFNPDDFNKALEAARTRYPEPSRTIVAEPADAVLPSRDLLEPSLPLIEKSVVASKPPPPGSFHMRIGRWPAKFVSPWRVGHRP